MSDINKAAYWQMTCKLHEKRIAELEAELCLYKRALQEACNSIDGWAQYAGEYFQEKHNLETDIKPETHLAIAAEMMRREGSHG